MKTALALALFLLSAVSARAQLTISGPGTVGSSGTGGGITYTGTNGIVIDGAVIRPSATLSGTNGGTITLGGYSISSPVVDLTSTGPNNGTTASGLDLSNNPSDFGTGVNVLQVAGISATAIDATSLTATGDVESTTNTKGVVLKSPNATRFRITVNDDGSLTSTAQ